MPRYFGKFIFDLLIVRAQMLSFEAIENIEAETWFHKISVILIRFQSILLDFARFYMVLCGFSMFLDGVTSSSSL